MNKSDYKDMWVYIEHDGKKVADVGLELCCEVRKLCDVTGDRLMAVIIGKLPQAEVKKVIACGVDGVIRVNKDENVEYNTEVYTNVFTELTRKYLPSAVFVGGTENGRDFAPRYAVRVDTGLHQRRRGAGDRQGHRGHPLHRARRRRQNYSRHHHS